MKTWCFIFPDPRALVTSARVAAPSREEARALLSHHLQSTEPYFDDLAALPFIQQFLGHAARDSGVIETVLRSSQALLTQPSPPIGRVEPRSGSTQGEVGALGDCR